MKPLLSSYTKTPSVVAADHDKPKRKRKIFQNII